MGRNVDDRVSLLRGIALAVVVAIALIVLGGVSGCIAPERAECDLFSGSCDACITQSGCGYCGAPDALGCVAGSSLGDRDGLCSPEWWSFAECDGCAAHGSCDSCTIYAGCAYCLETGRCATAERLDGVCTTIVGLDERGMCP